MCETVGGTMMSKISIKTKLMAGMWHGLFSLMLLGVALYLVFGLWFPQPLDVAMGVSGVLWIMLGIDLILGPLLTTVIYNPHKKELKLDLAIIVVIQLVAYLYGMYTISQSRPAWLVYFKDDVTLVRAVDVKIKPDEVVDERFVSPSLLQKPQWVASEFSKDEIIAKQQRSEDLFGESIVTRPVSYLALDEVQEKIKQNLKSISQLERHNDPHDIKQALSKYQEGQIRGYLPVKGYDADVVAVFDEQGKPVAILQLKPW